MQERAQGFVEAVSRHGSPIERDYAQPVSEAFLLERRQVASRRPGEVVLAVRRRNGRYLVHTKSFYPAGVYRLLSGGIHFGEELLDAVRREALEETGLQTEIEAFLAALRHRFSYRGDSVSFDSYLFLLSEEDGILATRDAGELISGFREASLAQVAALADALEGLPGRWGEWGRFRAPAHRVLAEVLDGQHP